MSRVLVAPDSFKGSLRARKVADALVRGLHSSGPAVDAVAVPVADGGEGTVAAALAAGYTCVPVVASGPLGHPVWTRYARQDDVAVVEVADVCGLSRLPAGRAAPLTASSRGVGEVLRAALDAGCDRIVLGIGGSACTDGGAGLVQALGARLYDASGGSVTDGGGALRDGARLDLSAMHPALGRTDVVIACDVDNPLTGHGGAAEVYGPQKGAGPDEVATLEQGLQRWSDLVGDAVGVDHAGRPGAGAAGGIGFAGLALLGGTLRPGIDLVLELVGFAERLREASLVVTGEGALDAQTLHGKAPLGVARSAAAAGVPTVAVAGTCSLSEREVRDAGFAAVYTLDALEPDRRASINRAEELLEQVGRTVAERHLARPGDVEGLAGHSEFSIQ